MKNDKRGERKPMTEEEMLERAKKDKDFRMSLWRVILKLGGSYPKKDEEA